MFHGYSTLGAVALRVMQNNLGCRRVRGTRHTIEQAIETICWRKKTLSASGSNTSYIWWWFYIDGGEIAIDYDSGAMTELRYENGSRRYVPLVNGDFDTESLISDYLSEEPDYNNTILPYESAMLKMGVQPYQKCLTEYTEGWSSDYYGESNCDIDTALLYVEPNPGAVVYLPIVLGDEFGPNPMKAMHDV